MKLNRSSGYAVVVALVGGVLWPAPVSIAGEAVFKPIPFVSTFPESSGRSVSHDGRYVAGHSAPYSFRWDAETDQMIQLNPLPQTDFSRYGWISADGSRVVGSSVFATSVNRSTMWKAPDWLPEYLGPNLANSAFLSSMHVDMALGISGNGNVVIGQSATEFINTEYHSAAGYQPYRWTAETGMETLVPSDKLNSTFGAAYDVNYDGSVIVGWYRPVGSGSMHAFRWREGVGELEFLGTLGNAGSEANAVNTSGSVIVGNSSVSGQGRTVFKWTEANGMQNVGQFVFEDESLNTVPLAVSDTDVIVGYGMQFFGTCPQQCGWNHYAFYYHPQQGFRDLKRMLEDDFGMNLAGWTLREARDVSPDGRFIVGEAINPFGQIQGFYVALPDDSVPPTCPGDLTGSGSVGVGDLLALLACWGPVAPGGECAAADLTSSGGVGVGDLLLLLSAWGPCP